MDKIDNKLKHSVRFPGITSVPTLVGVAEFAVKVLKY